MVVMPSNLSLKEIVEAELELEKEVDILRQNTQVADKIVTQVFHTHKRRTVKEQMEFSVTYSSV